ncbi:protein FAM177A1 [Patagioenas fasciata monilis]|uniref:Protein FAM177A1 n=1 Tax=Patagioenas fasciata monilis TaxID=372326 RepID=A0A1V4KFC7_PATFA|nr:protein FAM177A1 [Patagioenas fasciata monilis]
MMCYLPTTHRGFPLSHCGHGCAWQPGCLRSLSRLSPGSGCCQSAETCPRPVAARSRSQGTHRGPLPQVANGERGFENVELGVIGKKKKIPRRVIHFASGETMEEYSTDEEEDEQEKKDLLPPVDPTTLTWGPYLWFHMLRVATSTLSVCDFLGEKIASVLGISTPKYQYAIDEYYRMKREEEEEEQENRMSEEAERKHQEQQNKPQAEVPVQTDQPEGTACTSFVNVNFENEEDCQSLGENKQDVVPVPP